MRERRSSPTPFSGRVGAAMPTGVSVMAGAVVALASGAVLVRERGSRV